MIKPMRLTDWAEYMGVPRITAYRWYRKGKIPYETKKISDRIVMVYMPVPDTEGVALYARVSSQDQKSDLDRQVARLSEYAAEHDLHVVKIVKEVGSGMNENRSGLGKLLLDSNINRIVVEHKDRFGRMNVELTRKALQAAGRDVIVVDEAELDDDLVADMVDVLTSFCARLYGRRGAKNRAVAAAKKITKDKDTSLLELKAHT